MTVSIRVWPDRVRPFCLLAEEPLRQAAPDTDTTPRFAGPGLPAAEYRAALEHGGHGLAEAGARRGSSRW